MWIALDDAAHSFLTDKKYLKTLFAVGCFTEISIKSLNLVSCAIKVIN